MNPDQEPILVELVACPTLLPRPQGGIAEMPYRTGAWTPDDQRELRRLFAEDAPIEEIATALGCGRAGVADRICVLGLRRHSTRPWTEMKDADLSRRYGQVATATIASELGRSCAAVYARAGLLDLTEGNAAPWTDWEDAQLRAGYAADVPTAKIAAIIGRSHCGLVSRASKLGLRHPSHSPDWSIAEIERAIALSEAGHRYGAIKDLLVAEGYPRRSRPASQGMMNRTGHGTGWGRFWTQEEDELLTRAYRTGASLTPLRHRLGRSQFSIRWRSDYLGLRGTHATRNGWHTAPDWTEADLATLRADYGRIPTGERVGAGPRLSLRVDGRRARGLAAGTPARGGDQRPGRRARPQLRRRPQVCREAGSRLRPTPKARSCSDNGGHPGARQLLNRERRGREWAAAGDLPAKQETAMLPATIAASVAPETISKVGRLFNGSATDVLNELLQNARRAGAGRVRLTITGTPGDRLLTIVDDGQGIADPVAIVTLGRSGWTAETLRREDPAGMGVFSLAGRDVIVRSWSILLKKAGLK